MEAALNVTVLTAVVAGGGLVGAPGLPGGRWQVIDETRDADQEQKEHKHDVEHQERVERHQLHILALLLRLKELLHRSGGGQGGGKWGAPLFVNLCGWLEFCFIYCPHFNTQFVGNNT